MDLTVVLTDVTASLTSKPQCRQRECLSTISSEIRFSDALLIQVSQRKEGSSNSEIWSCVGVRAMLVSGEHWIEGPEEQTLWSVLM